MNNLNNVQHGRGYFYPMASQDFVIPFSSGNSQDTTTHSNSVVTSNGRVSRKCLRNTKIKQYCIAVFWVTMITVSLLLNFCLSGFIFNLYFPGLTFQHFISNFLPRNATTNTIATTTTVSPSVGPSCADLSPNSVCWQCRLSPRTDVVRFNSSFCCSKENPGMKFLMTLVSSRVHFI